MQQPIPPHRWVVIVGAAIGTITLLFFMALVFSAVIGYSVPCDSRALLASVIAFGVALSAAFFGGDAALRGSLPIPWVQENPLTFSAAGGIATFLIALLVGNSVFSCGGLPPKTLRITRIQLLDEVATVVDGPGTVLTDLRQRPTTEFRVSDPNNLHIAFLFVLEGYFAKPDLTVSLDAQASVRNAAGVVLASAPLHKLTNVKDWRLRPSVTKIGDGQVGNYLGLPSADSRQMPIPYLVVLNHFEKSEIPVGPGQVLLSVHDHLAQDETSATFDFRVVHK